MKRAEKDLSRYVPSVQQHDASLWSEVQTCRSRLGAIGGSGSTEFMILAEAGEDEVLYTEDGQYSANVEKAVSLPPDAEPSPFTTTKNSTPPTPQPLTPCVNS
jgi:prolyl-tRNA synthetase